jgi:hypothetical protein
VPEARSPRKVTASSAHAGFTRDQRLALACVAGEETNVQVLVHHSGSGPTERLRLDGYFEMIRMYATVALNTLYSV